MQYVTTSAFISVLCEWREEKELCGQWMKESTKGGKDKNITGTNILNSEPYSRVFLWSTPSSSQSMCVGREGHRNWPPSCSKTEPPLLIVFVNFCVFRDCPMKWFSSVSHYCPEDPWPPANTSTGPLFHSSCQSLPHQGPLHTHMVSVSVYFSQLCCYILFRQTHSKLQQEVMTAEKKHMTLRIALFYHYRAHLCDGN